MATRETLLRQFYVKRVRRLAPAYAVVLAASVLFAFLLLDPRLLRSFGKSLLAQPFYVQNIVFWIEGDYFTHAFTKPLLHTWSLAIEEQFYLLFGALVVFARWKRRALMPVLAVMAILSLAGGYWVLGLSSKTSFYLLPTRIWEFAIGIFAYAIAQRLARRAGGPWSTSAYVLSGAAMVYAVVGFDEGSSFPGPQALIASIAVFVLLVLFECRPSESYRLFRLRPVRYVGEISYTLYLWHWPIIVYLFIGLGRDLLWYEGVGALVLSFMLSDVTYRHVENPIRYGKRLPAFRHLAGGWATGSVAFLALGAGVVVTQGALFRYAEPERTLLEAAQYTSPYRCPKLFRMLNPTAEICKVNDVEGGPGVLVIGDSHADALDEMIAEVGEAKEVPVYLAVRICDFDEYGSWGYCGDDVVERILREVERAGIEVVIATSYWFGEGLRYDAFQRSLAPFVAAGLRVYFSEVVPFGPYFDPGRRAEALRRGEEPVPAAYTVADYARDVQLQRSIFERLHREYPEQVHVLRPSAYLCDGTECDFYTDGYPNYSDDSHLTWVGAGRLRPMYAEVLEAVKAAQDNGAQAVEGESGRAPATGDDE